MSSINNFESGSISKVVLKNAIPAIISMLVVLIYNMADTFFVGQAGDELQVAAVSLATPVFLLFIIEHIRNKINFNKNDFTVIF